jgi:hypothetical protein
VPEVRGRDLRPRPARRVALRLHQLDGLHARLPDGRRRHPCLAVPRRTTTRKRADLLCSPLRRDGVSQCATDADCTTAGTTGPCVSPGHCTNSPATACTTSTDCVAPGVCPPCNCPCTAGGGACCDGGHVGAIGVTLSPLTTSPVSTFSSTGRFCTGQGTGTHVGCFGSTACRTINETGSPAGQLLTNVPAPVTLASVFCIAGTGNALVNASADLPGPGADALPGTYEVHN